MVGTQCEQGGSMGTYREPDALVALLMREQTRVVQCLRGFAEGGGAATIAEARRVLRALADAEREVLYPAFARVSLRLETQLLLDGSRGERAQQLEALEALAHKRTARLRKLGAVALSDAIHHHAQQHISLLIPVLASQLTRPLYRSIVHAFTAHYEREVQRRPRASTTRRQRAIMSNA
jgi:hypothetical protein